jgi:hypothetical protein
MEDVKPLKMQRRRTLRHIVAWKDRRVCQGTGEARWVRSQDSPPGVGGSHSTGVPGGQQNRRGREGLPAGQAEVKGKRGVNVGD